MSEENLKDAHNKVVWGPQKSQNEVYSSIDSIRKGARSTLAVGQLFREHLRCLFIPRTSEVFGR